MITVVVFLVIWFERSEAEATTTRMVRMMSRIGLNANFRNRCGPKARAVIKECRIRCGRCRAEDQCERWLDGDVKGENGFCPNTRIFNVLRRVSPG